jgi:hypothetical protein
MPEQVKANRLTSMHRKQALHVKSLTDWVEENTSEILAIRSQGTAPGTTHPAYGRAGRTPA